jgi:hypothetical protein
MPPHIVALSGVANYPFFTEPDWSRKSAKSHISIRGLPRFQDSSEHISRRHGSHDSVNLSDISLESSRPNAPVQNNIAGIAPNLPSRPVESSPILSPASSHVDAIDRARPSTLCSPENFGPGGPDSSGSRKGRRKRSRATQINTSASQTDKQRAKVLAKNRMAANRYRLRQKEYVKNLEQRCKKEVEQTHIKSSIVKSLQQEIVRLKEELIRQSSLCNCMHVRGRSDIRDRLSSWLIG